MLPLIILGLLIGLPVILIFLLRSNASVVFLALCAGVVLTKYIGSDASLVLSMALPKAGLVGQQVLNASLVLLPPLATLISLRKKASGMKLILNIIPALAVGGLVALSITPYISPITRDKVMATNTWHVLELTQGMVVGLGILSSLILLKPSRKKEAHKKHGK